MEKWIVYGKKADFNGIGLKYGIDPVIARVIRNRDIVTEDEYYKYLNPDIDKMYSPWLMRDMKLAVDIINDKVKKGEKIRVIGDYDIDGVCSGHILTRGLELFGANVDFEVPDRVRDGYGINERLIKDAYDSGVALIVTCDNGIAAIEQIDYAKNLGMMVIVTDHHDIQFTQSGEKKEYIIPNADAVINPKQPGCEYPFKELCGASVTYKLIIALFERYGNGEDVISEFIEFAGIATIGDVVILKDENRIIASEGLKKINRTSNYGIKALINKTGLIDKRISSYHIGFVLGPCLNAGGRLDTAMKAYDLLHTESSSVANEIASELVELNEDRKSLTQIGVENAIKIIDNDLSYKDDSVLVINIPDCHESIVGIIAGRIRERYNKPVLVLTNTQDGLKGSGRSIEEYNMFEELVRCRNIFQKFGGHAMAAGVSLDKDKFDELRKTLNKNSQLTEEDLTRKVWIDVPMPFEYLSLLVVSQLNRLEPFGMGNEKPVFAEKDIRIIRISILGKNRNVVRLKMKTGRCSLMEGIYFGDGDEFIDEIKSRFGENEVDNLLSGKGSSFKMSVIYYPQIDDFNGRNNINVVIKRYMW